MFWLTAFLFLSTYFLRNLLNEIMKMLGIIFTFLTPSLSPFLSFQIPPHKTSHYIEENIKEAINKTRCKKEEGEKAWLLNRRKALKVLWASLI